MATKNKQYTKTHASKTAAEIHERKIKARGGKVSSTKVGDKYKLTYTFPK
jgi:hypothetical protein